MLVMPWSIPRCCLDADSLPGAVDVVVVGGSLAALMAARLLAEGGALVALVAEGVLGGFALSAPGLVLQDLGEHPHRLLSSVGVDEARAMHGFLADNRALLADAGLFRRTGSLSVAGMDQEGNELVAGFSACARVGLDAELLGADDVGAALSARGFGPGRRAPGDGVVSTPAVVSAAVEAARAAGATLCGQQRILGIDRVPAGSRLRLAEGPPAGGREGEVGGSTAGAGEIIADALVFAAGHRLTSLWPWFSDKLFPVRHQWVATVPVAPGRLPLPVSAQHGFSRWVQLDDGRVVAGGARFASPHLQIGETDADALDPRVDHVLRANIGRFFPDLADVPIDYAWAGIATHSCDGLPIIGPLPGRVDLVACTGMHGLDHALAMRAGQVVAAGLLTGEAPEIPRLFSARRMV